MKESWWPLRIASSSGNIIWKAAQEVSQWWLIISRWLSWWISKSCPGLKPSGFGLDCFNLSCWRSAINRARLILSETHFQGADPKFKFNPRNKTTSSSSMENNQLKAKMWKNQGVFLQQHHQRVWRELRSNWYMRHNRQILYWRNISIYPKLSWSTEVC